MQIRTMGGVGRRVLFSLRNALFTKLQDLPVAFFNQNKAGDLISRVNNDTDKLNQFVAQALMQFLQQHVPDDRRRSIRSVAQLPAGSRGAAAGGGRVDRHQGNVGLGQGQKHEEPAKLGGMSSEVQESLHNFKVIVAFNRMDYFQRKFETANEANYAASVTAGYREQHLHADVRPGSPPGAASGGGLRDLLIGREKPTAGLLIGFLLYVNNFYGPMRQLATVWSSFQLALAALDRISEVLALESDMPLVTPQVRRNRTAVLEFRNVSFQYPGGKDVLRDVSALSWRRARHTRWWVPPAAARPPRHR